MLDAVYSALLRAVLNESRLDAPTDEAPKRGLIAMNAFETRPKGEMRVDNLRTTGCQAPLPPPSMWN
jgi:hypothetical protein